MDKMPDWAFRIMSLMFKISDVFKSPDKRLEPFNIQKGQTVIDYGSGTGRYLPKASALVGEQGLVYAVDIQELAVKAASRVAEKHGLKNVKPVLADAGGVNIASQTADLIYCLDMFHMVKEYRLFLEELNRLTKPGGVLYLEDGHQPRSLAREKLLGSGCWEILEETKNFIKCTPKAIKHE